jgi:hypothetical protein
LKQFLEIITIFLSFSMLVNAGASQVGLVRIVQAEEPVMMDGEQVIITSDKEVPLLPEWVTRYTLATILIASLITYALS